MLRLASHHGVDLAGSALCLAISASLLMPVAALATSPRCEVVSGERLTPVIELYTSEGCSSCPPADQSLSTQKGKPVVVQAFHVGYWDYIGWVDRFASPAHTTRQREVGAANGLRGTYTPHLVRNGRDWRDYTKATGDNQPARTAITRRRTGEADDFEARVTPVSGAGNWDAYWTVREHGHSSRVKAGENAGEHLMHDFVVREYTAVGRYQGAQVLRFSAIHAQPDHPRQINLVVSDPETGKPLPGVSLQCS